MSIFRDEDIAGYHLPNGNIICKAKAHKDKNFAYPNDRKHIITRYDIMISGDAYYCDVCTPAHKIS